MVSIILGIKIPYFFFAFINLKCVCFCVYLRKRDSNNIGLHT